MTWIDFYTKFGKKLLEFKNNRNNLIVKIKKAFSSIKIDVPTIEQDNKDIIDITPFTTYALFNRQIKEKNRILIIQSFIKEFNVDANAPTDFIGIPVVNNMMTAFFGFKKDRAENDIDNLWEMFDLSIKYSTD